MLFRMVRKRCDAARWDPLAIAAVTAFLSFHYLLRDMLDGGPHLILLGMLVGGIYCAWQGRDKMAGLWFGLAIALKMTPGLFLPFMLWKRRWRLAAWTTLATLGWIALPAVFMGPANWWEHQKAWNQVALSVLLDSQDQTREGNEVRVQNQALKPALRRYLETYPPGHVLRLNHPADRPILDLSPALANRLANLGLLGLLAGFALWSRHRLRGHDDPAWLLESSGVLILVLLLSPLVWLQHVVFMLPAICLIVAHDGAIHKLPRPAAVVIWLYIVLSLVLNRELLRVENYLVLLSYHSHTLCMLLILGLLMAFRPTAVGVDREEPALPARRLAA
jgi:alpha-1,2-mannosyltransferase